jgi:hypothetical protein
MTHSAELLRKEGWEDQRLFVKDGIHPRAVHRISPRPAVHDLSPVHRINFALPTERL